MSRLKSLRVLDLTGCDVSANEIELLADLPRLEHLGLAPKVINDDTIRVLRKLPRLQTLSVHPGNEIGTNVVIPLPDNDVASLFDLLNPKDEAFSDREFGALDIFFRTQLPMLKNDLPSVNIDTATPSYAGLRRGRGPQIVELPELVDEKKGNTTKGNGVF